MRNATLRFLGLVIAVFLIGGAAPVQAQGAIEAVVALQGTPHLWFADEHGVLHWGGDTRALAGKHIPWGNRDEVSLDQLRMLRIGDPWLSAGLLKDGDPIYLVKWETHWALPQLLHIQSIRDVELFGINGSNYGRFVIEKNEWERRFGISAASLQRGVLASAVSAAPQPAAPVPAPAPYTGGWEQWDEVDLLTDARTIGIERWVSSGQGEVGGLLVRCLAGRELEVFIDWTTYLGSADRRQVWTRVDNQAVQSTQWSLSTNKEATFAPQPGTLIEVLKRASLFTARVVLHDQTWITWQWNVAGFAAAVRPVEAHCSR